MFIKFTKIKRTIKSVVPSLFWASGRKAVFVANDFSWRLIASRGHTIRNYLVRQPTVRGPYAPRSYIKLAQNYEPVPRKVSAVPQIVWMYWDNPDLPVSIRVAIDVLRRLNPDVEVRLLSKNKIHNWLPNFVLPVKACSVQHMTDLLRLELLWVYGGVWADAGMLFTVTLTDFFPSLYGSDRPSFDIAGFFFDQFTKRKERPVVENWFLAAPPKNELIKAWLDEIEPIRAGGAAALDRVLRKDPLYDRYRQNIAMPEYLVSHIALQRVLESNPYHLLLHRADDSALAIQIANSWSENRIAIAMLALPWDGSLPPTIKLTGPQRRQQERFMAQSEIHTRSLYSRIAALANT